MTLKKLRIMKKHFFVLVLCTSVLRILVACNEVTKEKPDKQSDTELIEKVINDVIGWAKNKDFDLLYSSIATNQDYLEVHPDGCKRLQ